MIEDNMQTALAGAAGSNPRQPMGTDAIATMLNTSAISTSHATLQERASRAAGDPAFFPTATRQGIMLPPEPAGARHAISVSIPVLSDPGLGRTQAQGRIVRGGARGRNRF